MTELETQLKLGNSEVVPLRYEVQRLKSEVDSISSHANWLESEHKARSEQLAATRTKQAAAARLGQVTRCCQRRQQGGIREHAAPATAVTPVRHHGLYYTTAPR